MTDVAELIAQLKHFPLDEAADALAAQAQEIKRLNCEWGDQSTALGTALERADAAEAKAAEQAKEIEYLQVVYKDSEKEWKQHCEDAEADRERWREACNVAAQENLRMEAAVRNLQTARYEIEAEHDRLRAEIERVAQEGHEMDTALNIWEQRIAGKEAECASLRARNDVLREFLRSFEAECKALRAEKAELVAALTNVRDCDAVHDSFTDALAAKVRAALARAAAKG